MEQQPLFDQIDFRFGTDWQTIPQNSAVPPGTYINLISVPGFRCPSSGDDPITPWNLASDNYGASCGPTPEAWDGNPSCPCDGRIFYLPYLNHQSLAKNYYNGNPAGPFTRNPINWNADGKNAIYTCTMGKVLDGLTNTIFFARAIGQMLGPCPQWMVYRQQWRRHAHNIDSDQL